MKYRFNLVPESYRMRRIVDRGNFLLVVVLLLFLAGLAGIGILYEKRFVTLQGSLARLNYQKNQLLFDERTADQILARISEIQTQEVKERKVLNLIKDLLRQRIQWSKTMAEITHIVPDGAWLQSMSSTGEGASREIVFRGVALSNQWVARFLFLLENHPDFSNVRLEYSRIAKVGERDLYSFEVKVAMAQDTGRI
jgi:Tfp pilus assembly protein PilN